MSFQILCCSKVAKFLHLAEEIICDPRSTAFFPSLHRLEPVPGEMCSRKSSHGETWEGGRCATNKQKRATKIFHTRSLGALQAPTSSFRPFEPPWLCPSRPSGAQAVWPMHRCITHGRIAHGSSQNQSSKINAPHFLNFLDLSDCCWDICKKWILGTS